jgi:ankyrin repeat protein
MKQIFHFRLALFILTLTLFLVGVANYLQQREIARLESVGRQDAQIIYQQQAEIANLRKELATVPPAPASHLFSAAHLKLNAAFQRDLNQLHVSDDPAVDTVAAQARSAINKGASPNVASSEGIRALHIAAFLDDGELAEQAIQQGADVNARDSDGFTPLHVCAMVGSPAVARLLAANGADKNAKDKDAKTPLQRAEENDQMQLVLILRAAK